ncbi:thioesterase II family protein [Pseudomonas pseudonitroreducens]|uniref:thioesterase II family protein n=1 Tax=Pseudomonas pseudonitroreducens TaxID=2892326 RepID=UPI0023AEDCCF|nr:alpha/beta fold hydrolase [Pseudomonas pseudonitroreducens]
MLRLFCLPYSGASAMLYARWKRQLPAWLEVCPVELPGRGRRFAEPLQTDLRALASQLADEIAARLDQPYAVFGHSLGGLLAFELVHALRERGLPLPQALFASAASAPARRDSHRELAQEQSDAQLIERMRRLGGTASAVFADAEMLALTLPVMRADFLLCGLYDYRRHPQLTCPIHVFGGKGDRLSVESLSAWQDETCAGFSLEMLEGGHFFINTDEARLLELMLGRLRLPGQSTSAALA